jgi:hypothetical protein
VPLANSRFTAGGTRLIQRVALAADAASLDFAAIPATFRHLLLIAVLKAVNAGPADIIAQFNADATARYNVMYHQAAGGAYAAIATQDRTSAGLTQTPLAVPADDSFIGLSAWIYDYTSVTVNKQVWVEGGTHARSVAQGGGGERRQQFGQSVWAPAVPAAINAISILPAAGNLRSGSHASLYGLS